MAIIKYDPFGIQGLLRWPNSVFDEEDGFGFDSGLDIYETENEVCIRANVAGIKSENVDVTFEKGVVWIQGQEESEENKDRKYYRKSSRNYSYKVAVPGNIDWKVDPEAKIEHGILELKFKKAEEAKPRKINVS